MVVLQHDHRRKVIAMLVYTADEHAVFFDEPETRGSFAGTGEDAGVPGGAYKG